MIGYIKYYTYFLLNTIIKKQENKDNEKIKQNINITIINMYKMPDNIIF